MPDPKIFQIMIQQESRQEISIGLKSGKISLQIATVCHLLQV